MPPEEAMKRGNKCPVCGRQLTKGVEQRVEELADRPKGFRPPGAIDFKRLLPLAEIIAECLKIRGKARLYSGQVWELYMKLVNRFGNELNVLLSASLEELEAVVPSRVAEAIVRVREGRVIVRPGYDGVYGRLILGEEERAEPVDRKGQTSIVDYLK
jgi:PHP family Zn ribbon phosphoesterase